MKPVVKPSLLWLRPSVLAVCLAMSSPLLIQTALAQTSKSVTQAFDIPAGPLDATLTRIARQSGQIISIQPEQMQGRSAPAVRGEMSADQAYRQALQGSGLELFVTGSGALNLRPVPAGTVSTLPEVKVRGSAQEDASGSAHGYVAKRSATGTKMNSSIIETPQSISVVTAQEMEVTKPQSLTDALAYTAGVFRSEGNDRTADRLYIRGFGADAIEGSLYRDGMKYMVNAFNGKQEVYGLERIEVLKGAASVLYGSAAPGGIINTVTKRPTTETLREVNMEVGSYNRKQISADLGGALTDDGVWSYRLTALKRDSDTFVDFVPDDRIYVAPALKWQPSADTSLTLLSHYQKSKSKYVFGFPAAGTVLPNPNGRIPVNRYLGEPDRDRYASTIESIGYIFEHAFSDTLRLRNNVSFFKASTSMPATWPNDNVFQDASMRTVERYAESIREDKSSALALDVSLEYKWKMGEAANTLLVGLDHTKQEHQSERWRQTASSLDLYNPVYGLPYTSAATLHGSTRKERAWLTGAYLQNQTKIDDKWVVLLGGRQDKAKNGRSPLFGPENWKDEKSSAFSGRAGLVYLADNGLAPFVSWSESFQPQAGSDRAGNRFDPTTGSQYEMGLRYQPKGSNTLLSAVVYQLTRQNVLTTDPTDNAYSVQTGEARSRGLELEAKVQVNRSFGLVAAYAYTDARTTRSNDASAVGKRTGAVPYNQFSAWGDYNFHALGIPGLKAGAGVRYIGSTVGTYMDVKVPAFTLLDAMVAYEVGHWRYAFNITNLTDKVHVTNCIDVCYYGEPRKAVATASYRW